MDGWFGVMATPSVESVGLTGRLYPVSTTHPYNGSNKAIEALWHSLVHQAGAKYGCKLRKAIVVLNMEISECLN